MIVFARFWRILRVINGVIVGTKSDADTRARYLKKKIALLQNHEYDNQAFQENLQEAIEENARLNLLRKVFKFMSILTSWLAQRYVVRFVLFENQPLRSVTWRWRPIGCWMQSNWKWKQALERRISSSYNSIFGVSLKIDHGRRRPYGRLSTIDRFLWNKLSGINADSEQSLAVWNRTRKIINEMDLELDENQPPKYQPSIKKIIIKPDPNEPTESKSLD